MSNQMQVAFTVDKNGRPVAYRWSMTPQYGRWFRIGYDDAKLKIATGEARQVTYVKNS